MEHGVFSKVAFNFQPVALVISDFVTIHANPQYFLGKWHSVIIPSLMFFGHMYP